MSSIEQKIIEARYEQGMDLARRVSQMMTGGAGVDRKLIQYFTTLYPELITQFLNTGQHGHLRDVSLHDSMKDLIHLGVSFSNLVQEIKFKIKDLVFKISNNDGLLIQSPHRYSKKEISFIIQKYLPDTNNRMLFIDLFFGEKGPQADYLDFLEVLHGKPERRSEADEKMLQRKLKIAGKTFHEIALAKERRNIINCIIPQGAEIIEFPKTPQPCPTEEPNFEKLQSYHASLFVFCVIQLSKIPEIILWATDPEHFLLNTGVNPTIKQKLDLISNMSAVYGFPDYTTFLEGALKAYMRVVLDYKVVQ